MLEQFGEALPSRSSDALAAIARQLFEDRGVDRSPRCTATEVPRYLGVTHKVEQHVGGRVRSLEESQARVTAEAIVMAATERRRHLKGNLSEYHFG